MCYSALVWADYRRYVRDFGVQLSVEDFYDLFCRRLADPKINIPRGMEEPFRHPQNPAERQISKVISAYAAAREVQLQQDLFAQRARLAEAERKLATKVTKAATESQRIATHKVDWLRGKLTDLHRTQPVESDSRIFPGRYAPVMVMEDGKRVVKPMRYQCRPAGKPAFFDTKFPGTYNARRDNLEGFWREQFGYSHGLMVVNVFYENVKKHRSEGRALRPGEPEENVVLEFRPRPGQNMLVACLWSKWSAPGEPDLLSFAAITDEPPPEVAAAGHDRCIIPIQEQNIDRWLSPNPADLRTQYQILDDRFRPYYEHRMVA